MKLINVVLVSLALSLTACQAKAADQLQSPSQIVAMMDRGDLNGAERAVKKVLEVKDTAKVHYILAQVYLKQGKRTEAQAELARANMMDPEHSYTDNAHYRPVADAIAGRVIKVAAAAPVAAVAAAPVVPEAPFNFAGLWVFLGILAFGALCGGGYLWYDARERKRLIAQQLEDSITSLRSKVARLVQDVGAAILNEKTSAAPVAAKLSDLAVINTKVLNLFDRAKNTAGLTDYDVSVLLTESESLRIKLTNIEYRQYGAKVQEEDSAPAYTPPPVIKRVRRTAETRTAQVPRRTSSVQSSSASTASGRDTVVVSNGSNLVTDLLMVDMMLEESRRRDRDEADRRRRAERDEEERKAERRAEERREEARRQEESSWSSRSSSSDSSNNDSWSSSSSSSDSGSNDSWSSSPSSSSDSGSSSSSWD